MSSLGEKGEEKREEERERKRERRKEEGHPLGVAGDGERFPFPLLARTMPTFLMYPVFPPPPPILRRRRGLNADTRNESCATMEASITSKDLLENCYYYFFIIAGILELLRWKYGLISANLMLQIFFCQFIFL